MMLFVAFDKSVYKQFRRRLVDRKIDFCVIALFELKRSVDAGVVVSVKTKAADTRCNIGLWYTTEVYASFCSCGKES